MTDLFRTRVTAFMDIPETETEKRHFERRVIERCQVTDTEALSATGTVVSKKRHKAVITKDVSRYVPPEEYYSMTSDERKELYTVSTRDFIVLCEVNDEVTNAASFAELQSKYKENGIKAVNVSRYINGLSTDNIQIS